MPTAIEYFKLLPKTNCKDCGQPTCLAFAMQLANQKAKIEDCPHVDSGAKDTIAESAAPPVKTITVGNGSNKIAMGGETVLFRHERRFINPIAYALTVSDELGPEEIAKRIEDIKKISFDRIGMISGADLAQIAQTAHGHGFLFRRVQRRQQHSRQDRYDRYNDKEFYQRKIPRYFTLK